MAIKTVKVSNIVPTQGEWEKWGMGSRIKYENGKLSLRLLSNDELHELKCSYDDYVVIETNGPGLSSLKKAVVPDDPRLKLLWENGFRKATRVTMEELWSQWDDERERALKLFPDSACPYMRRCVRIENKNSWASIMLLRYTPDALSDKTRWVMDDECSLEEVQQALAAWDAGQNISGLPMYAKGMARG